jgi:hypothetical protein
MPSVVPMDAHGTRGVLMHRTEATGFLGYSFESGASCAGAESCAAMGFAALHVEMDIELVPFWSDDRLEVVHGQLNGTLTAGRFART